MINLNQIQSFETWQEAFDGVKRAVDDYHMKFWEELEKMTKIDESKKYKFSEIIAMLEGKELPAETVIRRENKMYSNKVLKVESNIVGEVGVLSPSEKVSISANIALLDINSFWSIKLPKEDKFYLKAPFESLSPYFHYCNVEEKYKFLPSVFGGCCQGQFTKKEIDAMPFDTNFFEKVKVGESV